MQTILYTSTRTHRINHHASPSHDNLTRLFFLTLPLPFITNKRARPSDTLTLQNTSAVASLKFLKKLKKLAV